MLSSTSDMSVMAHDFAARISHPTYDVLLVDDSILNLKVLSTALIRQGYRIRQAKSGPVALALAQADPPDIILLDIRMPDMDGYETCYQLKSNEVTRDIPVIFLTALDDSLDKVKAFSVGGVDYITKPFEIKEVLLRVDHQLRLRKAEATVKQLNVELEQRVQARTAELEAANHTLQLEINERKRAQDQLLYLAMHDPLTGLFNRAYFMQQLAQVLLTQASFTVMYLDCDRFKIVNDSLGHLAGDQLLVSIARRLESCLPERSTTIARLGGDEFCVLIEQTEDYQQSIQVANTLLQTFKHSFELNHREIFMGISIGIVVSHQTYQIPEHVLRDADIAMYQAKANGRNCYEVFSPDMHAQAAGALQLETDLRLALSRQEFCVVYQPIVSLQTGYISGFEALIRWHHQTQGLISPAHFIPLAEETGLIVPIGEWVLRQACSDLQDWSQTLGRDDLSISVNLSVKQFAQPSLASSIDRVLLETHLQANRLKLEITESALMDNADKAAHILDQLKTRKIHLSIDDFGTGYSSLSYLHRFPADTLKIDRSFIQRLDEPTSSFSIVEAAITLAHKLEMSVVAEGIETQKQFECLKSLGCELGQGYLFSKPISATLAKNLILNSPVWQP